MGWDHFPNRRMSQYFLAVPPALIYQELPVSDAILGSLNEKGLGRKTDPRGRQLGLNASSAAINCVASGKFLNLLVPQFPHL